MSESPRLGQGSLYSEVQCIIGNGHIGTPCRQTDMYESITFLQLHWRVVMIKYSKEEHNLFAFFIKFRESGGDL